MRRSGQGIAALCAAWLSSSVGCITLPAFSEPHPLSGGIGASPTYTPGSTVSSPTPSSTVTPPVNTTAGTTAYTSYLHQSGGYISDANGTPVDLHGIGWWGFDTGYMLNSAPTPNRLGTDIVVVMQRLHLLGFNLIQIPFAFSHLYNADGSHVIANSNVRTTCGGSSTAADIIASVTLSGVGPAANTPLLTDVPTSAPGMCNDYLPDGNMPVVQRLAAIIDIFTRNGFYILLQQTMKGYDTALWDDAPTFTNRWSALSQDLVIYGGAYENIAQPSCTVNPNTNPLALCRNLLLGLMGDVESITPTMTWEAGGGRAYGAHRFYVDAMSVITQAIPRSMMVVGGAVQSGYLATFNTSIDARTGPSFPAGAGDPMVASAAQFFAEILMTPGFESRTVFSLNAFGPTTNGQMVAYENDFATRLQEDLLPYGTVALSGVPDAGQVMHPFPVILDALGGNPADINDASFLNAMQQYTQGHNMYHYVWWCWGTTSTYSSLTDQTTFQNPNASVLNYLRTLHLTSSP